MTSQTSVDQALEGLKTFAHGLSIHEHVNLCPAQSFNFVKSGFASCFDRAHYRSKRESGTRRLMLRCRPVRSTNRFVSTFLAQSRIGSAGV